MKNTILFSLSLLASTLLLSCETDDLERQTGDKTLSCYIDGKLFVPQSNNNITSTKPSNNALSIYNYFNDFLKVKAVGSKTFLYFNVRSVNQERVLLKESDGSFHSSSFDHASLKKNGVVYISKEGSGVVNFLEYSEENIQGTFEFTLYNEDDESDTIEVTDGRFND